MNSITRFVLTHRRLVVVTWILLTIAGGYTVSSTVSRLSHDRSTPGSPGYDANQLIQGRLGVAGAEPPVIAVLQMPSGKGMDTAAGRAAAARAFNAAHAAGHVAIADFATTGNPKFNSADGRTTWALINMPNPDIPLGAGVLDKIPTTLGAATPHGATLGITGSEALRSGTSNSGGGGPSVLLETLIGMLGALIILAVVYGSVIAIVPLMMAVPSILVTFLLVGGLTHITSINTLTQYMVAFVGLGVSIDYSLLIVTRWREERQSGLTNEEAIAAAADHAGRAVVLSGLTVAIGLLSLVVLPVPFLRSIGYGGMLIPLVAIAIAVTLLPVTLAAWGPRLDRRRIKGASGTYSRTWARWGGFVVRWKLPVAVLGSAVLFALAIPAFGINTGQPGADAYGSMSTGSRTLQTLADQGVPKAVQFPIQVLAIGGAADAAKVAAIADATPGVYTSVINPAAPTSKAVLVSVVPKYEGNTAIGRALVTSLRANLNSGPGDTKVGGETAQNTDFVHAIYGNFPLMLGLMSMVMFLILARAFRSLLLAAKAVLLNLVSLGAAYGFMVLFWQHGHGSELIFGQQAIGSIRDFIPILVFAFLFGLSMDYEVFVLARIREEYDRTGSTNEAIVEGLGRTGRLVTSAALILAVSFLSLSTNNDLIVRVIATSLAFGILFDAFVVRTLLVPALIALFGKWNWWMPNVARTVLRVHEPAVAESS